MIFIRKLVLEKKIKIGLLFSVSFNFSDLLLFFMPCNNRTPSIIPDKTADRPKDIRLLVTKSFCNVVNGNVPIRANSTKSGPREIAR